MLPTNQNDFAEYKASMDQQCSDEELNEKKRLLKQTNNYTQDDRNVLSFIWR